MNDSIMVAVGAGLGAMLGWGLADFLAKKTIDEIGDITTLAWAHFCGTIVVFFALVVSIIMGNHVSAPSSLLTWLAIAGMGVLQGLVYLLVYRGFGKGQVSVLNPIFAAYSGVAALLVVVLAGDTLGWKLATLLLIVFVGVMLLSLEPDSLEHKRVKIGAVPGFPEIITATVLAAIWTVLWAKFVNGHDWLTYAAFMYAWMTVGIFVLARIQSVNLRFSNRASWAFLVGIGATEVAAYICLSWGFSVSSHPAVVAIISGAFSVPTVLLARVFLGEQINYFQALGILAIVAGVSGIALVT